MKLFYNIGQLYGITQGEHKKSGADMARLGRSDQAWLLVDDQGHIADFGSGTPPESEQALDLNGALITPGFVDSHTHLVFASGRESEFVDKIRGLSYEEIAARGGGILNSAQKLADTSEDELFASAYKRLVQVYKAGTTTLEIKSGYGLSLDAELKILRVIRRLKAVFPGTIKATFLGAHAVPKSWPSREAYVQHVIADMLPAVAQEGLADYCDVFCDQGYFTPEETQRILSAAAGYGIKGRIHANELAVSGGVQAGIAAGALSVDHLERISDIEIQALKASDTMPTALPGTSFFLKIPYAPGRTLVDSGLPLALASDYNPGSSPSGNMALVMSLACIHMGLLPEEALNAVTLNSAYSLELATQVGSIERGKRADFIVFQGLDNLASLPYWFGHSFINRVYIGGKVWNSALIEKIW